MRKTIKVEISSCSQCPSFSPGGGHCEDFCGCQQKEINHVEGTIHSDCPIWKEQNPEPKKVHKDMDWIRKPHSNSEDYV